MTGPHIPAAASDPPGRWLFLCTSDPPPRPPLFGLPAAELAAAIAALGPDEFLWLGREPGGDLTIVWPGAVRLSTEEGEPL